MLVGFFFDPSKLDEAEMADRCWEFYRQQRLGVNEEGLAHILGTRSGELIVRGAAQNFEPEQHFSRAELAAAIGHPDDAVFSWIRQLGRPEKKFAMKVFQHHDDGTYSLSRQMHAAILRLSQ